MTDVPKRIAARPTDKRGWAIPFVQFIAADGTPDFRTIDAEKLKHALQFRRCGLCGEPMGRHIYFVGGPKCVQYGVFYDPPMHRECAIYSLQTCPHLARSKGRYADPTQTKDLESVKFVVGEMDTKKSEWFGLMHSTAYTFEQGQDGMVIIRAKLPWVDVERWKDGAMIKETTP